MIRKARALALAVVGLGFVVGLGGAIWSWFTEPPPEAGLFRVGRDTGVADAELENLRIGYKAAIDLWITSSNQNWSRFNAMLVANTVIVAAIVQIVLGKVGNWWGGLLPIAGLILCALWFFAVARGLAYQDYYVASARRFEEHLGVVDVVRQGHVFAQRRMPRYAHLQTRWVMYIVILLFAVLYVASTPLLWPGGLRMTGPLIGKLIGSLGLLLALVGTIRVGWIRWQVTAGFAGGARIYGPEPGSQVEGTAEPADLRRWRRGWTLILMGFLLQLVGLWIA